MPPWSDLVSIAVGLTVLSGARASAEPKPGDPAAVQAPAPAVPSPPPEIAELGKLLGGTWKCKGDGFERDGTGKAPITATLRTKVDLERWWISEALELKGRPAARSETFTTFDAANKKWRRVSIESTGSQLVGTAAVTPVGTAMTFNLDLMGPSGPGQLRQHVDPADLKAGLRLWSELSVDKGKTWTKLYDLVCKRTAPPT